MYYGLLARFSATVEFLAPRLLRREVVISAVVLLLIGAPISRWFAGVAAVILWCLFVLWLLSRMMRRVTGSARLP